MHTNPDCPKGSDVQKEASPASRCLLHLVHHLLSFFYLPIILRLVALISRTDDVEHTGGQSTHLDPHKWQTSFAIGESSRRSKIEEEWCLDMAPSKYIHIYNRKTQSSSR
jgi:hypothetical protein